MKKKKKLLLLGGTVYMLPAIAACKKNDIIVYTVDYLPNNIAHKFSDGYYNVSTIDKEAVLELAKKLDVDGINAFAADAGMKTAAYVAEKLNLPCVADYKTVELLQDKPKFRTFLRDNGFDVPVFKGFKTYNEALKDISLFKLPIIVKPADSAGSKGVTKITNLDNLKQACEYALQFSLKKEFIIEEFIETIIPPSDADCFSIDGKLTHFTLGEQYYAKDAPGMFTPYVYVYPTTWPAEKAKRLKDELQRLITLLGLKTSIYNVEARVSKDGTVYIMEVSPRAGGNRIPEGTGIGYNFDIIEATMLHAVGEPFNIPAPSKIDYLWVSIVIHSVTSGTFDRIVIDEKIKDYIVELDMLVKEGDKVEAFTGSNKMVGTAVLKIDSSIEEYFRANIYDLIKVKVK
jgi:biotin carboxylase